MAYPQISDQVLRIVLMYLVAGVSSPLLASQAHADIETGSMLEGEERTEESIAADNARDISQSRSGTPAENETNSSGDNTNTPSVADESLHASAEKSDERVQQALPDSAQPEELTEQDHALKIDQNLADELDACIRAFEEARNGYVRENEALAKMQDERAVLSSNIEKFRDEVEHAQAVIDAANDELACVEGSGFRKIIMSILKPHDYESQLFLLHMLIEDRDDVIVSSNAAKSGLERKKEELDERMAMQGELRRIALERVNSHACEIEACCSRLHQYIKDANANMTEGSQEAASDQQGSVGAPVLSGANIVEAESLLMQWYAEMNALSGMRGGLSFGEGADFSMNQAFFVEKWGTAIDAFFEKCEKESGESPLKGFGKTMASSAYKYHIDPRLCAAVSMAESSGGRYCIKPHNAWGWGAADSDPYGGALSWSTWEEAIEAWHKGMAESKTGLANARTVSVLANIYCSSPIWGVTVAGAMNDISARTLPESLTG